MWGTNEPIKVQNTKQRSEIYLPSHPTATKFLIPIDNFLPFATTMTSQKFELAKNNSKSL